MAKHSEKKKGFSTPLIVLLAILGIAVLAGFWWMGTFNSLVGSNENVSNRWAQVETQYQRRFDLITTLVKTVKSQTSFEAEFITNLTALNTRWQAGTLNEKVAAAGQLDSLLSRLLVAPPTSYPAITSAAGYQDLRDELANTENKVAVERGRFNDAVASYNRLVKFFPSSIVAGATGFGPKEYFQAAAGAESAPDLAGLP